MNFVRVDKSKSYLDAGTEVLRTGTGALKALSAILKQGKRDDLLPHSKTLLQVVSGQELKRHHNVLLRKFSLKVIQRIGLTFLKSKVAAWRYQRGSRSLALNLQPTAEQSGKSESPKDDGDAEEEEYDIPEEIEEVIEELLGGLRDKETVIRWSAAKGVGRVTSRLPKELADDVVETLLQLFSLRETDAAWHGGCLALAELGRRGLLLPQRLIGIDKCPRCPEMT